MEKLPYEIIPGEVGTYRESIFLERAIVGERIRLAMGLPLRDVTEENMISEAWRLAPSPKNTTIHR